jgi:hypothetical protein
METYSITSSFCCHCSAPILKGEVKCCREGSFTIIPESMRLRDSLLLLTTPKLLSAVSRIVNAECALGYLNCQTVRESHPRGIQEPLNTARPAMLYVNGSPLAARQTDLTLLFYDRLSLRNSGGDNQTLILNLCRVTRNLLLEENPLYSEFRQHSAFDQQNVQMSNPPNDAREIGIIFPESSEVVTFAITSNSHYGPTHHLMEPLLYPCLFPSGANGWFAGDSSKLLQYIVSKLYQSKLHRTFARLSQQWLLHQYTRWRYLDLLDKAAQQSFMNSMNKRVTSYRNFCLLREQRETLIGRLGCIPPSVTNSVASNRERIYDLAATMASRGVSDMFITFTATDTWEECSTLLRAHGNTDGEFHDHTDIVARAFYHRNLDLKKFIQKKLFPSCAWLTQSIEFQKRLHPLSHTLLRTGLSLEEIMLKIDEVVTCEIPPTSDPELRLLVETVMSHKCSQRCVRIRLDGTPVRGCEYGFPKPPCERSHIDENGVFVIKRRQSEEYIVCYNASLLKRYKAHINVEFTPNMQNPSYIMKYIFKGQDFARDVRVGDASDARGILLSHAKALYISASQATWEILGYDMYTKSLAVVPIHIHLPNEQCVDANSGDPSIPTMLQRYFYRPRTARYETLTILQYYAAFWVANDVKNQLPHDYDTAPPPHQLRTVHSNI